MSKKRLIDFKNACVILTVFLLCGCGELAYYYQSAQGQVSILSRATPIDTLLAKGDINEELKEQLEYIRAVRHYASATLALPQNRSYSRYADLERDYVVWNVVAVPAFSLKAKHWCYPIIGCQLYRGYFKESAARELAAQLDDEYDVITYGVTAYSTLGFFADPVLNTFVESNRAWLTALIFHELSHQVVYIEGDTQFNESFATAVEELGLERWQQDKGVQFDMSFKVKRQQFIDIMLKEREKLNTIYENTNIAVEEKKTQKSRTFTRIFEACTTIYANEAYCARYREPNNAWLALAASYEGYKREFKQLFMCVDESWAQFYDAVEKVAKLEKSERERVFANLTNKKCTL